MSKANNVAAYAIDDLNWQNGVQTVSVDYCEYNLY